jgi:hypothetical protein
MMVGSCRRQVTIITQVLFGLGCNVPSKAHSNWMRNDNVGALKLCALLATAAVVVGLIVVAPDLKRYIRIHSM